MTSAAPQPGSSPPPPEGLELAPGVRVAESALRFQFARSSGPGGQNVNKVNSKAEVWVPLDALRGLTDRARGRLQSIARRYFTDAGELHIASDSERTQSGNRAAVMERLREVLIAALHEPKPRRKTRPSRGARQRRLDSKKRRSDVKANRRGKPED